MDFNHAVFYRFYKSRVILGLLITVLTISTAQAWRHEVSVGYGWGNELSETYQNEDILLNVSIYKFNKISNTLFAMIDCSLANLKSATPNNNKLVTAAASLAFRAYFQNPELHKIRPYLGASIGPAYLSQKQLGTQKLGSNIALQSLLGGGIEFGLSHGRGLDVSLHLLLHYCNGGLAKPNNGFDIPYGISIGYQF